MENKKTAVEWLVNVVQSCIAPDYIPKEIIEQAKEMEKQQLEEAYRTSIKDSINAKQ
jgi:hypothetical protein